MSLQAYRKWLAFGTGVGIELGDRDLNVVIVHVRPNGARVVATQVIERYAERPATEWGAEYSAFLQRNAVSYLAAAILLPRRQVIVRQLSMPGVNDKDLPQAIGFQIDGLHPYNEDEAVYDYARIGDSSHILVGITRRDIVDKYVAMFAEAGVKVASFTFSAAVVYGSIRMFGIAPPAGFLAIDEQGAEMETYGESESKPVFTAVFDVPSEAFATRARALALSELRLQPDTEPIPIAQILPTPIAVPEGYDVSTAAMTYATALAGAAGHLFPNANLLPPELRVTTSRTMYIPSIVLGVLLVLGLGGLTLYGNWEDSKYQQAIEKEIKSLEPVARRPMAIEREITVARHRSQLIDNFRRRTGADLEVLNDLTHLIAQPGWAMNAEITRDQVRLNGESDQATGLLRALDKSPLFEGSEFAMPLARTQSGEAFSIRTRREGALP